MSSPRRSSRAAVARAVAMVVATLVALVVGVVPHPGVAVAEPGRGDWHLRALDAYNAWRVSTGTGVVVAVLDSGVDARHPDLEGQILPGADFVDGTSDGRRDTVGHGTTVASLIAGRRDSGGQPGLAPGAKILPVRVLDDRNRYDDAANVAKAVRWAVDHGASVLNLSLGGPARSDELAEAIAYAAAHDVVVIACTGNLVGTDKPTNEIWYPAREPGVVAVAGLSSGSAVSGSSGKTSTESGSGSAGGAGAGRETLWSGSITGPETVLTAPATHLRGARPNGRGNDRYWTVQGTSFAAPLVAAAATLLRSKYPDMSAANVINRLIHTARDLGPAGRDDRYGFGEVNPVAALRTEVADVATNPLGGTERAPEAATVEPSGEEPSPDREKTAPAAPAPARASQTSAAPAPGVAPPVATPVASSVDAQVERLHLALLLGGLVAALLLTGGLSALRRRHRDARGH